MEDALDGRTSLGWQRRAATSHTILYIMQDTLAAEGTSAADATRKERALPCEERDGAGLLDKVGFVCRGIRWVAQIVKTCGDMHAEWKESA